MQSPVKQFVIDGLFGDRNVALEFQSNVAIVVDPNGSGKTTFMRALVCILCQRWHQLAEINFESAALTFHNNRTLRIRRDDLLAKLDMLPVESRLASCYSDREVERLMRMAHTYPDHPSLRQAAMRLEIPYRQLIGLLRHDSHRQKNLFDKESLLVFEEYNDILTASFPLEVVYFPTYRRVERALSDPEERDLWDDMSIHYGMDDVEARLGRITQEIKESFVESYAKTNGQMLSQLIDGIHVEESDVTELAKSEYIDIVLERLGNNISKADKEALLLLIKSNKISDSQYNPLVYFVNNLMNVYREQRDKDDAIKRFAKIVNGYFTGKEVVYNESSVSVGVRSLRTGVDLAWQHLSSGEKQIASIFSRLYLSEDSRCAILFDEPELSLSLEWQRNLLADIYDSASCKFLFAATHSPFIYENILDKFATTLSTHYSEGANE